MLNRLGIYRIPSEVDSQIGGNLQEGQRESCKQNQVLELGWEGATLVKEHYSRSSILQW